jgi:hypothetical protein
MHRARSRYWHRREPRAACRVPRAACHVLQRLIGLVVAGAEGILAWTLLENDVPWGVGAVQASMFLTMFTTLWILIWAIANGPLQITFLRWRYRGGRFIGGWG